MPRNKTRHKGKAGRPRLRADQKKHRKVLMLSQRAWILLKLLADEEGRSLSAATETLIRAAGRRIENRGLTDARRSVGEQRLRAARFISFISFVQWVEAAGSSDAELAFLAEDRGGLYRIGQDEKKREVLFGLRNPAQGDVLGPVEVVLMTAKGLDRKPFMEQDRILTWAALHGREEIEEGGEDECPL